LSSGFPRSYLAIVRQKHSYAESNDRFDAAVATPNSMLE